VKTKCDGRFPFCLGTQDLEKNAQRPLSNARTGDARLLFCEAANGAVQDRTEGKDHSFNPLRYRRG
jgi:hypothetical protein